MDRNCHALAREIYATVEIANCIETLSDFAELWRTVAVGENHSEFPGCILHESPSAVGMAGGKQFAKYGVEHVVHDEPDAAGLRLAAPSQSRQQKVSRVLAFPVIGLKSSLCHDADVCAVHTRSLSMNRPVNAKRLASLAKTGDEFSKEFVTRAVTYKIAGLLVRVLNVQAWAASGKGDGLLRL